MHDLFSNSRFQNGFEGQDTGATVYIKNVFIKILTSMIKFTMYFSMALLYLLLHQTRGHRKNGRGKEDV